MNKIKEDILHSSIFTENSFIDKLIRKIVFIVLLNKKSVHGKDNIMDAHGIQIQCKIKNQGNGNKVYIGPYGVDKKLVIVQVSQNFVLYFNP